jgi:hypothetical protein
MAGTVPCGVPNLHVLRIIALPLGVTEDKSTVVMTPQAGLNRHAGAVLMHYSYE